MTSLRCITLRERRSRCWRPLPRLGLVRSPLGILEIQGLWRSVNGFLEILPLALAALARSQMDGRADHTELMPRLGPVSAPSVAGDSAESNTRKVLKEISTSLKASHTAIRHCARLCHSAYTTFNEEAETVSDARAQVDALLSVMPR